ncbi:hypothetical protein QTO34_014908 [Cnephaeus nilssonii]|uniref:Protein ripply3 n=1 Tax=Cnephaeus nilssonii TaxID=3371016 RepID=A0AA40LSC9_CNENI|nr:hypothetical protein QTO34_014908 [Eptesicus nilssonii]
MLAFTPGPFRSSPTPWRPWTLTPRDAEPTGAGRQLEPGGDQQTSGPKGAFGFQHPVRLYLPISKRQEYLQTSGEKVLASFPVQATIHFYNDASDSEDGELEEEARLLPQEAQGPGAGSPGDTERGPGDTEHGPGDTGHGPGDTERGPGDMERGQETRNMAQEEGAETSQHTRTAVWRTRGARRTQGARCKGGLPHGDSPGGAECSSSK